MSGVVVALGGNALQRAGGAGDWEEARRQMRRAAPLLAEVAAGDGPLVITHGNGPQVGALLRQNELAHLEQPSLPLDVLGAQTQGQIGYLIASELAPALARRKVVRTVLPVVSRTEVRANDPAFRRPTKPIGRHYSEPEARVLRKEYGWVMIDDRARGGWRRLVPSPRPVRWLEGETVAELLQTAPERWVPVVMGGGGVPVVRGAGGSFRGVEAVVDKDLGAALVGRALGLSTLAIVTDVPGAATAFGRSGERWLRETTRGELARLLAEGEFGEGSMRPKVEAGLEFLRSGGTEFLITDIPSLPRALAGEAGTRVR